MNWKSPFSPTSIKKIDHQNWLLVEGGSPYKQLSPTKRTHGQESKRKLLFLKQQGRWNKDQIVLGGVYPDYLQDDDDRT